MQFTLLTMEKSTMITERTLTKWRKEALQTISTLNHPNQAVDHAEFIVEYSERILRLTQELLDAHLIRKVSK